MYYGARYYDPALSRFITPDTIYDRGPQGLNRYSYVLNNPIRYIDPSGHLKEVPRPDDPHHTYRTKEFRAKTLNALSNGMEDDEEIPLSTLAEDNPDALAALNVALGGKAHQGYTKENTVDPLMNARTETGTDGDMTMLTKADIAMVIAKDKERLGWMIDASENDIDVGIFGLGVAAGAVIRAAQPSAPPVEETRFQIVGRRTSSRTFRTKGSGTNFERHTTIGGRRYRINSGHGYDRSHRSGDVRNTGLSRDLIENALLDDLVDFELSGGTLPQPGSSGFRPLQRAINIEGHDIGYNVIQRTNGTRVINTYYPK